VGNGLTGVSEWLRGEFEQAAKEAERSIVFHRTICKFLAPSFEFAFVRIGARSMAAEFGKSIQPPAAHPGNRA
jgi:hypothetical protein